MDGSRCCLHATKVKCGRSMDTQDFKLYYLGVLMSANGMSLISAVVKAMR